MVGVTVELLVNNGKDVEVVDGVGVLVGVTDLVGVFDGVLVGVLVGVTVELCVKRGKETRSIVTAYQKEYLIKDGVLNKFVSMADFIAQHT